MKVFIFEMVGGYYRGLVAMDEETAHEIAVLYGHEVKELVRVENHIEYKGDK